MEALTPSPELHKPLDFQQTVRAVGKVLQDYITKSKAGETVALDQKEPHHIAKALDLQTLMNKGFSSVDVLATFVSNYLEHTNHLKHPHYMGHQVAVPQDLSGIPEWIHGTVNNPSSLYEMGPAGATLEGFMIHWMLSKLGWFKGQNLYDFKLKEGSGGGILTHGGSIANLTALCAARAAATPDAWTHGNATDWVVMGPASAHYSIGRALSIMGMGSKAYVGVPVDENEVIRTELLEKTYQDIIGKGKKVMAVIANACATSTGLFDPLPPIADFCEQHGLWLHVDGAHGACVLLSEKERRHIKGIERADSIIWDAHKMMRVPALCTAVLFRNYKHLVNNFKQKGSYVFHESEVVGIDSMPYTIECTKSALGTKLFWTFALEGTENITQYIENTAEKTKELHEYLTAQEDFYCPYVPQSNILCFQYLPEQFSDAAQLAMRYQLINQKEFYITSCEMNGKRFLRTVIMNPHTDLNTFKALVNAIRSIAEKGIARH